MFELIYSDIFVKYISCLDIDWVYIDGLMQERRNSIANALELRLSCTNPSISYLVWTWPSD